MERKIKPIRQYSLSEELINSISHGVGAVLGIIELIVGVVFASIYGNIWGVVSMTIYGISIVLLFLMSSIYHGLTHARAKAVFRILDHSSIFVLIAGTYTPYTLVLIREYDPLMGWIIFSVVWGLTIFGAVINFISVDRFKIISMIAYLGMGWMIVFAMGPLMAMLTPLGLTLLFIGGMLYTLGVILYGIGAKHKYFHSVWHFFVLAGSLCHYFSILFSVILPTIS